MSSKQADHSVCLAMIVRDEAPIIQRALLSVKPYIDSWLIYDMGSKDNTQKIIEHTLADVNGQIEQHTLREFASARNQLLSSASRLASTIIMLDADEVFQTMKAKVVLPDLVDAGVVDVVSADYTIRVPRVFRSSNIPHYRFSIDEKAVFSGQRVELVDDIKIKHHRDGIRHRHAASLVMIEQHETDLNSSAQGLLHLGQQALHQGLHEMALHHFRAIISSFAEMPEFWQASYLAANILHIRGDVAGALELFRLCFDSAPDRAEPLMRIAEIQHQHGESQTAHNLCKILVDMPIPEKADYFEPNIYTEKAQALLKETAAEVMPKVTDSQQSNVGEAKEATKLVDEAPKLTIGMATFDDYDGVYFSVMSLVLYHKAHLDNIEILIIDNNPDSEHGKAVKGLCSRVKQARYVAAGEYKGTAVRERIFAEARAELVLCMDCHVFLHEGVVERLLDYAAANPNAKDLLHGPIFYDDHETYSTHMEPTWNSGFFGTWGVDKRGADFNGEPFEIPLQGMGLFACFKSQWLGFNHRFRGFGGEEGYIHEKVRQHGGRVLCLPFLRWTHRFDRPAGTRYVNVWNDRIRNYLIGWHELGLDTEPVLKHFGEHLGFDIATSSNAEFLRELNSGVWGHDTLYLLCKDDEQRSKISSDLSILALDRLIQPLMDQAELPKLLRAATDRGLSSVIIIDARLSTPEHAHVSLQKLTEDQQSDVVIQRLPNTQQPNLAYCSYMIRPAAFETVAMCIEQDGMPSQSLLRALTPSLSITNLPKDRISTNER